MKVSSLIIIFVLILSLLTLATHYYGSTDIGDYMDVSKFFAGEYQAKLRSSHSLIYGLIHAPLVKLTKSFIFFKITSIWCLLLLTLSLYYISNRNKKTLLLFLTTPIVWYLAPWASPLQLFSLLFLWAYYFMNKYEEDNKIKHLFYSGFLIGLSWAIWDASIFLGIILGLCFFYNKKLINFFYLCIFMIIGTIPKFISDYVLFGFPFYSIVKYFFSQIVFVFYGGMYSQGLSSTPFNLIFTILFIPFFSYLFLKKDFFNKHKKTILTIIFSVLFILANSQIRYVIAIVPLILLLMGKVMNDKQFKIQLVLFIILSLLVIQPYLFQIKYEINGSELKSFVLNLPMLKPKNITAGELIKKDLDKISLKYPNETFVVGNLQDDYSVLAHYYWVKDIKEFVSIQDYNLWIENKSVIYEQKIIFQPKIEDRREIWLAGGINKNHKDATEYDSICYGIGLGEPLELGGFYLIENHSVLYISKNNKC